MAKTIIPSNEIEYIDRPNSERGDGDSLYSVRARKQLEKEIAKYKADLEKKGIIDNAKLKEKLELEFQKRLK